MKTITCPHCHLVGYLICHGFLRGYKEDSYSKRVKRGRRFICNGRSSNRNGCNQTFSILYSGFIKFRTMTASSLWAALLNILDGSPIYKAFKSYGPNSTSNAPYGIIRRFRLNQDKIRSCLIGRSPPEDCADTNPYNLTTRHIKQVFKDTECPITAFQESFQMSIL